MPNDSTLSQIYQNCDQPFSNLSWKQATSAHIESSTVFPNLYPSNQRYSKVTMIPHDPTISSLLKLPGWISNGGRKIRAFKTDLALIHQWSWSMAGATWWLLAPRVNVVLLQDAWRNQAPELRNIYLIILEVANFPSIFLLWLFTRCVSSRSSL